jgi:DNA (cytosine-5)-methyltransferase 1
MGYAAAGFEVVGVDSRPMPRYPFEFVQADAMAYPLDGFDVIHASPPCQAYSITRHSHKVEHPDLLPATLERLRASGKPWIVENVVGAPLTDALTLCGSMFNLLAYDPKTAQTVQLQRHRLFQSSVLLLAPGPCRHAAGVQVAGVYGGGSTDLKHARNVRHGGYTPPDAVRRALMGIDWMSRRELAQAIPPVYTQWLGDQNPQQPSFRTDGRLDSGNAALRPG